MKTNPSLRIFKSALAIVIAYVISVRATQAGYVVTLEQVGPDVVATGSGAIDLTGLSGDLPGSVIAQLDASAGVIETGFRNSDAAPYFGTFNGPSNFGGGLVEFFPDSGSGDFVGIIESIGLVFVPPGYHSGDPLSDSATYDNATFSSLGVTPGTYESTWGSGVNQNFTIDVAAPAVPDSGSTFGLLLVALGGLFGVTRFRRVHSA